jgi:potassium/hydrogen antiporter
MSSAVVIGAVGFLIFLAHLLAKLFEKTRVPDVLALVLAGLLLGPVLDIVRPEHFGKVGGVFATLTLIIMLFEGGLDLDFATLGRSLVRGSWLTVLNFTVTAAVVTALSMSCFGLSWLEGLLMGAILGGTSSAVVMPLVDELPLQERSRAVLILESTFSDVLCIVGTLALLQVHKAHGAPDGWAAVPSQVVSSFLMAALLGGAAGLFWSSMLRQVHRLENGTFTTPAFVFVVYGLTELLGWSGAIAALAFGVVLGNVEHMPQFKRWTALRPIKLDQLERTFLSEIVFLLKTFFFVYLGTSIRLDDSGYVLAGVFLTGAIFALRLPVVRLSLDRTFPAADASLAAVMTPKGLAAAVLAGLPLAAGVPNGESIQNIVYSVVLFSVVATSLLCFLVEKKIIRQPFQALFGGYQGPAADAHPPPPAPAVPGEPAAPPAPAKPSAEKSS